MGSDFLESYLQLPTQDKPLEDLGRVGRWVSAEQAWRSKVLRGSRTSTHRMVTGGLPARYQTAVWEVSSTMRVVPSYQETAATV